MGIAAPRSRNIALLVLASAAAGVHAAINRDSEGDYFICKEAAGDVEALGEALEAAQAARTWTPEDSRLAIAEGWELFSVDRDGQLLEIQRIDAPEDGSDPRFASDAQAVAFVYDRAIEGSELHRRALLLSMLREDTEPAAPPGDEVRQYDPIDLLRRVMQASNDGHINGLYGPLHFAIKRVLDNAGVQMQRYRYRVDTCAFGDYLWTEGASTVEAESDSEALRLASLAHPGFRISVHDKRPIAEPPAPAAVPLQAAA